MSFRLQFYAVVILLSILYNYGYCCDGVGNYSVVIPNSVSGGEDLKALLWICPDDPGSDLTVEILDSDSNSISRIIVNPNGNALNVIDVPIGSDLSGSHVLRISNDLFTTQSLTFKVSPSPLSILVQTDKPIYKPGQKVNLRILAIDKNLRGQNETVTVVIADTEGNKIKQWRDRPTNEGLIQLKMQLSSRPPLGDWTITVNTKDDGITKIFKVDEYVLPKFEVSVGVPSYILTSSASLDVTVSAGYTYGEDVVGVARIVFTNGRSTYELVDQRIQGEASFTLAESVLNKNLALSSSGDDAAITVQAFVTDSVSEVTLNGSSSVSIYMKDVKVTFMDVNPSSYRAGQTYVAYFEVSQPDGSRISQSGATLIATATSNWWTGSEEAEEIENQRIPVPSSGICRVQFDIPSDATSVHLKAEVVITVGDETMSYVSENKYLESFTTEVAGNYLQLSTNVAGTQQINDVVTLSVSSPVTSGAFSYLVIARGAVVGTGSGSYDSSVQVTIQQSFTPKATILVFGIVNGELLADSITFNVNGLFENGITMDFANSDGSSVEPYVEPGTDIELTITTTASSIVGLLAVDKSVLLLGSGNDITQAQIESAIVRLVTEDTDSDCDSMGQFDFWWPSFGGKSSAHVFASAGLTFDTDAQFSQCYEYGPIFAMEGIMWRGNSVDEGHVVETSAPSGDSQSVSPRKRQLFPETWLWELFTSEQDTTVLTVTAPDTITTWVTTALSLHPVKGLSVTSQATEVTVKLPFFISPVLPYSAVRGEQLQLKIVVSNYGDSDEDCIITVDGSDDYGLKENENNFFDSADLAMAASVPQGTAIAKEFWVEANKLGDISISATATCNSGKGEAFTKTLLVKPPGFPLENCQSRFIELSEEVATYSNKFDIAWPSTAVSGSHFIKVMATGDVLGPTIDGLDKLITAPTGCGEQNMITLAPSIFVRGYLDAVSDSNADLRALTKQYMEDGYQRELTYKHDDGSFSAFGNSDPSGSTWLTAFVLKCFRQSQAFIDIDEVMLAKAETWLSNQIANDGSFNEPGKVLHSEMQGGTSGGLTLSAFVVIAYLEGVEDPTGISVVQPTVRYLEDSYDKVKDSMYPLSVITYALTLAQSDQANRFLQRLDTFAIDEEGGRHWGSVAEAVSGPELYFPPETSNPGSVEMTAYCLLTYLSKSSPDMVNAKKVSNWLSEQRNSLGGYHSTQDTILGLQALAAYASHISGSGAFSVEFAPNSESPHTMTFTASDLILSKKHWFSSSADQITEVDVTMNGEGTAILTACMGYNVLEKPTPKVINITTETTQINGTKQIIINACAAYTGNGESGMTLMRFGMPTGYSTSSDDVEKSPDIALIEFDEGSSELNVYFNQFTSELSCIVVHLNKDMDVREIQDAYIEASQYYNSETIVRSAYNPMAARLVEPITGPGSAAADAQINCVLVFMAACLLKLMI